MFFGFLLETAIRKIHNLSSRVVIIIALLIILFLIWAELAVGILVHLSPEINANKEAHHTDEPLLYLEQDSNLHTNGTTT